MKLLSLAIVILIASTECLSQNPLQWDLKELPRIEPAAAGFNADSLTKMLELVRKTPPNDIRGIVVLKDNKLVMEEYFNTYWRETIHDIRSAGKSVTAILLGIAIDKGLLKSEDQSVYDFFPQAKKTGRQDITIRHLLNMSSGLAADDDDSNSPGNPGNWLTKADWPAFALALPEVFKPGEKFVYNDLCPVLIGAIIEKTSKKKLADFAKENLFTPLGIREYYWYTAVNGSTGPMGNLYISTLDFAKIGQLVINKGIWNGKKIVSTNWIDKLGKRAFTLPGGFSDGYGYFWWAKKTTIGSKVYDYFFASGNGGNVLFVIPQENLVVAITSSAYGQGYGHHRSHNILNFILKARVD